MGISDLMTVMVALFTITFTAIGGIGVVLFRMNGVLGRIQSEMKRVLDRLDDHDYRIRKLEKKRR